MTAVSRSTVGGGKPLILLERPSFAACIRRHLPEHTLKLARKMMAPIDTAGTHTEPI